MSFFADFVASLELSDELLALSATGLSAAAVAVAASIDFLGSLDLEREVLVAIAAGTIVGLAKVALAEDHRWVHSDLEKVNSP